MILEDHRWASGSHEPSEIIYKIVCVAVHFAKGEKSIHHAKQIRNKVILIKRINTWGEKWVINSNRALRPNNK